LQCLLKWGVFRTYYLTLPEILRVNIHTTMPLPAVLCDCKIVLTLASITARSCNWGVKEQDAERGKLVCKMEAVTGIWTEL